MPSEPKLSDTPDISKYAQFDWYQYVWVIEPKKGEMDKKQLMKFIGVTPNIGSLMTFWCLPASCESITRSSLTPLNDDELAENGMQQRIKVLDKKIQNKIGDHVKGDIKYTALEEPPMEILEEDTTPNANPRVTWDPMEPESVKPEADDYTAEAYDNAQVSAPIA